MRGPQNGDSTGDGRGSNLNLRWSKCGIQWVDQWLPISWLHIGNFLCMLGIAILFLLDYSAHFTCIDSLLYIVWLAVLFSLARILSWSSFEHDVCVAIRPDRHSLCVVMSDISYILFDCMLHDYHSSAWLHVACLSRSHIYPPTSHSLGFGHSFHPGSHYCKCETFCALAL